jgi:pilus assembly protein Flp/PilA
MSHLTASVVAKLQALWATREQGATAVEYGLLVALIAAVIVVVVAALGGKIDSAFSKVNSSL